MPPDETGAKSTPDQIADWIARTGYRLEFQTAEQLRTSGLGSVFQGQFYPSPNSSDLREVDVVGSTPVPIRENVAVHITLIVECKYTSGTPWVNLLAPSELGLFSTFSSTFATPMTRAWLNKMSLDPLLPLAPKGKDVGVSYGFRILPFIPSELLLSNPAKTRPGDRKRDKSPMSRSQEEPFWAIDRCLEGAEARASLQRTGDLPLREIILPVVVVDGDLFECRLLKRGELRVKPVDNTILLRNVWGRTQEHAQVHIVRSQNFGRWAKSSVESWAEAVGVWARAFTPD